MIPPDSADAQLDALVARVIAAAQATRVARRAYLDRQLDQRQAELDLRHFMADQAAAGMDPVLLAGALMLASGAGQVQLREAARHDSDT